MAIYYFMSFFFNTINLVEQVEEGTAGPKSSAVCSVSEKGTFLPERSLKLIDAERGENNSLLV